MHWLPVAGFTLLGLLALYHSLRPDHGRRWSWGRGGGATPLSRTSHGVWGLSFLCIAWVLAQAPSPSPWSALALLGCLIAVVLAGIADHRAGRANGE